MSTVSPSLRSVRRSPLLALALAAAACEPQPPDACIEDAATWIDEDQDGYVLEDDCNDDNDKVHPLAFDDCNKRDDDCDKVKDEGWLDVNGDGVSDCETSELCNGVDDDGDGRVDEGFEDFDGDSVPDCLDNACVSEPALHANVEIREDCLGPSVVVTDPWNVGIEWQWTVPSGSGVIVMPAIGNLSDDNRDGKVDTNDMPDITFTTWGSNTLVAMSGDGRSTLFTVTGVDGNAGVTVADVDKDGLPDIVAATAGFPRSVVVYDNKGTLKWRSARTYSMQSYPQPAVADLEGDGDVEIVFDTAVLEGKDGSHIAELTGISTSWRTPVLADLDADGNQEILLAENVYDHRGARKWGITKTSGGDSVFAAVADIDGDVGGESFWVAGREMYVHDDDGTLLRRVTLPGSDTLRPGPPAIADFDGDGDVEIVVPSNSKITLFETDGTQVWSNTMRDFSGIAGASGYDVDGDGAYEVTFADENFFRIYDGKTGLIRYENGSHTSGTLWEYPSIADVDNDKSAEIVIASNGSTWRGITVFGHTGSGWAEAGPTWPTHDFCVTNVNPDLSVPSPAPLPWTVHNVFRARPVVDTIAIDLTAEITDLCVSSCQAGVGVVDVQVQVSNLGAQTTYSEVPLALYAVDGSTWTLLDTRSIVGGVEGGEVVGFVTFSVPVERLGAGGLAIRIDDDGSGSAETDGRISECFEDNNVDTWPYRVCGP